MMSALEKPGVVAVGGAPLPVYGGTRPRWMPEEFNWIFGCAYRGLPTETTEMLRVIGSTFAARRADLLAVGGFAFDVFEDMDISHKLLSAFPGQRIIYEPRAVVRHFVARDRLNWSYFVRRVFWVNRGKVAVMRGLGSAGNLKADREFVIKALTTGLLAGFRELWRGDIGGPQRSFVSVAGILIAACGYVVGSAEWHLAQVGARRRGRRAKP
jgi:hypothetical protein